MGCYIEPRNASITEDIAVVIRDLPYRADLLVAVYLNANLEETEVTPQMGAIGDELEAAGLMYMGLKFLPRRKPWLQGGFTWRIQRGGREVRSWTDYILGTDHILFQYLAVRDTQHH